MNIHTFKLIASFFYIYLGVTGYNGYTINTPSLSIHISSEMCCPETISLYSPSKLFNVNKIILSLNDLIFKSEFAGRFKFTVS